MESANSIQRKSRRRKMTREIGDNRANMKITNENNIVTKKRNSTPVDSVLEHRNNDRIHNTRSSTRPYIAKSVNKSKNSRTALSNSSQSVLSINITNTDTHSNLKRQSNVQEGQPQRKRIKISNHKNCNACSEHVKSKSKNSCKVLSNSPKTVFVNRNNTHKQSKRKRKTDVQKDQLQCKHIKTANHNRCNASEEHKSTKPPAVKTKTSNVPRIVMEFPCKKSIFEKACNLRQIVESGELLPDSLRPLLNENEARKYNANELATTIRKSKLKWQPIEKRALALVKLIRAELSIHKAYLTQCLIHLDELNNLDVDALMLKRNPILVNTAQMLCRYIGNIGNEEMDPEERNKFIETTAQIRNKSTALFQKFRKLFNIKDGQPFMRLYKDKIREYEETKNSKFLKELCQKVTKGFCKVNKPRQSKKRISENNKN